MYQDSRRGGGRLRSGSDDIAERSWKPVVRFVYNNPIYTVRCLVEWGIGSGSS